MQGRGIVQRNTVILEAGVHLPDGTRVTVTVDPEGQVDAAEVVREALEQRRALDVHFVSPAPVPSWGRRAPARLQKPRWSVALPEDTLENWQCIYETDI